MKFVSAVQNITLPLTVSTWLWFAALLGLFGGYAFWLGHKAETSQNSELQYLRHENNDLIEQNRLLEERVQVLHDSCEGQGGSRTDTLRGLTEADIDPQRSFVYTVNTGDTMWDIATLYDVEVKALMRWNNLGPKSRIFPGDQLLIMLEE